MDRSGQSSPTGAVSAQDSQAYFGWWTLCLALLLREKELLRDERFSSKVNFLWPWKLHPLERKLLIMARPTSHCRLLCFLLLLHHYHCHGHQHTKNNPCWAHECSRHCFMHFIYMSSHNCHDIPVSQKLFYLYIKRKLRYT